MAGGAANIRRVEIDEADSNNTGQHFKAVNDNAGQYTKVSQNHANDNDRLKNTPTTKTLGAEEIPDTRPRDRAIRLANENPAIRNIEKAIYQNPSHPTSDQIFSQSYAEAGQQPSVGSVGQYRSIETQARYNTMPTTNPSARSLPEKRELVANPNNDSGQPDKTFPKNIRGALSTLRGDLHNRESFKKNPKLRHPKKMLTGALSGKAGEAVDFTLTVEATADIVYVGVWVYLAQALLALLALALLTISVGVKLAEFEDLGVNTEGMYLVVSVFAMFLGYFTLLGMGGLYMFLGIPCLSGRWEGTKMGFMMLGFVGYSAGGMFPLLNLFPWAIFWLGAVFFAAIPIPKSNKNS